MSMMNVRRVVTAVDADGRSVIASDEAAPALEPGALPGFTFFKIWGTEGETTTGAPNAPEPYWPPVGGTRFLLVRWAPQSAVGEPVGDPAALAAEAERELPGLLASFEEGSPMHTSDTVDYGLLLEGEMWLEVDDGQEVRLEPGTCVVQRGTRHAWTNRSDAPALMMFVLVGARRA